jgi:hypothetical protein
LPYDETEISQLLSIFTDAKVIAATSYTNLSTINNGDIDNIQALAESCSKVTFSILKACLAARPTTQPSLSNSSLK